jgi:hypothetical protein
VVVEEEEVFIATPIVFQVLAVLALYLSLIALLMIALQTHPHQIIITQQ